MPPQETLRVYLKKPEDDPKSQSWRVTDREKALKPEDEGVTLATFLARYSLQGWHGSPKDVVEDDDPDTGLIILWREKKESNRLHQLFELTEFLAALLAILATTGGLAALGVIFNHAGLALILSIVAVILVVIMIIYWRNALASFLRRLSSQLFQGYKALQSVLLLLPRWLVQAYRAIQVALARTSLKWLLRGYRIIQAEYLFQIHDIEQVHQSQTTKITLKALQYGVELFEVRNSWTGKGLEESPKILSEGHQLLGAISPPGGRYKYYYIHLGHMLLPKEETTIEIRQDFLDHQHMFQPFLSKTVTEPLDKLVLGVKLPDGLFPINIAFVERNAADIGSPVILLKQLAFNAETHEIYQVISKPHLGHRYEIRWSYHEGKDTHQQLSSPQPSS